MPRAALRPHAHAATLPPMKYLLFLCCLLLPFLGGCGPALRPLQIEPASRSAPIAPKFSESYYYFDRDQTLYFILRGRGNDATTGKAVEQVITARVFWRPKGGVTTLNPSGMNTTFRYVVMTPDSIGMYEGAGFVLLQSKNGDKKFTARFEGGDMRLTQASANFVDTLGRAHIKGSFQAQYNDARAVDMMLSAQREFFARSLESKSATMPATQPESQPATESAPATAPATAPASQP